MSTKRRIEAEQERSTRAASVFDIRQNWDRLRNRPDFQEPVIDGVRAIAILWVVLFHIFLFHLAIFPTGVTRIVTGLATSWIQNGTMGVDLFFVISGFLIGSILFDERKKSGELRFSRFYVRRFLRLIPVYVAAMVLGLYFLHNAPNYPKWGNAENAWANLFYCNNFVPLAKQYMGWCWSLAIEEQFYLLLPAFILLFIRFGRGRFRLLTMLMVLSVAIRFVVIHFSGIAPLWFFAGGVSFTSESFNRSYDVIYDKPWMRFGGLLAGVAGAYLSCYFLPRIRKFFAHTGWVTALSALCLAAIAYIASTGRDPAFSLRAPHLVRELWWAMFRDVFSLAAMFLILAAIHTPRLFGGWLRRFLSWKKFYPVAQLSYSIYLVHEMLFFWLFPKLSPVAAAHLGNPGAFVLDTALGLTMTLVIAVTFYLTIEQPCMRVRSSPAVLHFIQSLQRQKRLASA